VAAEELGIVQTRHGSKVNLAKAMELVMLLALLQGDLDISSNPTADISLRDPKTVEFKISADGTDVAGMDCISLCMNNGIIKEGMLKLMCCGCAA